MNVQDMPVARLWSATRALGLGFFAALMALGNTALKGDAVVCGVIVWLLFDDLHRIKWGLDK